MNTLFRQEVVERQSDRLHGEVLLLPTLSHTLVLVLLSLWVVGLGAWLALSTYARKETVLGWLEPPAGVIRVYAEDVGIIKQVLMREGDTVAAGQPLLVVESDRALPDGDGLEKRLLQEYETQSGIYTEQVRRTHDVYKQRRESLAAQIEAAQRDLALLGEQLTTINDHHSLATAQVERHRALQRQGLLATIDLDAAVAQELALRSEQQGLARDEVRRRDTLDQLRFELELLHDEEANAIDQLRTQLSDTSQKITQLNGQRSFVVRAPRAGVVNNLQAREGQQAYRGDAVPLLTLIPPDAELVAELLIPVRSVGFIEPGQILDIRYDAFPYQKFGLYSGQVTHISETVLLPQELLNAPLPSKEPVYRVTAEVLQPYVEAYGRRFTLKAGMTISADVRLEERSMLQWLLEPIYSLKGRL